MKLIKSTLAAFLVAGSATLATPPSDQALKEEAMAIVKRFAGTLKPELKRALETGGPTLAITVCSAKAPAIAKELSEDTGWQVNRVSLKPRNPDASPDEWETVGLSLLADRQAANDGTDPLVLEKRSSQEYRLMKAQVVEPVCLRCHGTDITPDVAEALSAIYPDDQGIGYTLGEIRGAISLRKSF